MKPTPLSETTGFYCFLSIFVTPKNEMSFLAQEG